MPNYSLFFNNLHPALYYHLDLKSLDGLQSYLFGHTKGK